MIMSGTTDDKLMSPTVNQPSSEMIMIEEEYVPHVPPNINHRYV